MGVAIMGLQFGVDRFITVPAVVGLAVIVGGGGAVYAVTAYILGAVPAGLFVRAMTETLDQTRCKRDNPPTGRLRTRCMNEAGDRKTGNHD